MWFLFAYLIGTFTGFLLSMNGWLRKGAEVGSLKTIDVLVKGGYLKYTTLDNGEIRLLKHDEGSENP